MTDPTPGTSTTPDTRRNRHRLTLMALMLVPALVMPRHAAGTETASRPTTAVGIAAIEVTDPVGGGAMPGFVFHPTTATDTSSTPIGPYRVAAAFGLPATAGRHPLVVISHGQGGSSLGLHGLATHLAGRGFVVAALEHPRDNFRDGSGTGRAEVLYGRPAQVSALIDTLLSDTRWQPLIDPDRIGVAGFSMGGYTALLLAGAVPRFGRYQGYCERHPEDRDTCDFIAGLADNDERASTFAEYATLLDADLNRWGAPVDPRVKAAFAMAPTSVVFDAEGASTIRAPVFLYHGENDRVLPPAEHARHLQPLIPAPTPIRQIPGAGHYVFLTPCSAELARDAGPICTDPPGVDRGAVHERINADALDFFRKALDVN